MTKLKLLFPTFALAIFLLMGCAIKTIPIKGKYLETPYEAISNKSKDQVWDKIIDFYAQKGLSIRIIDKSSGLIISDKTALTWTFEDSKGNLTNPDAWIVIEKSIDPGANKVIKPASVSGDWNIRIKALPDNKTSINVNVVNIKAKSGAKGNYGGNEYDIKAFSTGNFEKLITDQIK